MMQPLPVLCWLAVMAGLGSAAQVDLLHSIELDRDVIVHWTPENETNSVTIRVEARTRGWAAIGFSPAGGMAGADIVMAWVTDGHTHIQDMYAVGNGVPLLDERNDVHLLDGYENTTHTVFTFRRPLRSCDTEHDLNLGTDTTRLIWALHPSDPAEGGAPSYHGPRRGVRSVSLDGSGTFQFPTESESESMLIGNSDTLILTENTHYHCEIHKMPSLGQKVHYTGYRVRLDPATAPHVHHIVLYACSLPPSMHDFFEDYVKSHPGTKCYSKNMPPSWSLCQAVMVVWAVGSEGDMLPDNVGMPLGAEYGGATYLMMETHYDNPQVHSGMRDNSRLELFFTRSLRPVESGMITAGHMVTSTQLMPPGQRRFTTGSACSQQCTQKHLPSEGVQVHSVMLHGHLAARAIRLRHVRDGRELPVLVADEYYDFNYQQSRRVNPLQRILPGDTLLVECDYDTQDRTNVTMGGFSTYNEMCIAFITYFPRTPLSYCGSKSHVGDFLQSMDVNSVGVAGKTLPPVRGADVWISGRFKKWSANINKTLNDILPDDRKVQTNGTKGKGGRDSSFNVAELSSMTVSVEGDTPSVSLYEYLMKLDWDQLATERLQKVANGGRLFYRCGTSQHHDQTDYKNIYSGPLPYPEFEPWVPDEKTACAEPARGSADRHCQLGGATIVLAISFLRLLV